MISGIDLGEDIVMYPDRRAKNRTFKASLRDSIALNMPMHAKPFLQRVFNGFISMERI